MVVTDPIDRALDQDRSALTEAEAKKVLAGAGVPVPESQIVTDPEAAAAAAERIGYPVVVKVSSPAVGHKSEWGGGAGVALGLTDRDGVMAAARDILAAGATEDAEIEVLVESAVDTSGGTELIVGGTRSDSFGPTVVLGLGGVLTEVLDDTTHRLAPLTESEVRLALGELSGADLLRGYRDRPAVDVDALAAAVVAVGDLLVDRQRIREVDLNPVLAGPEGAIALDATMVVSP